MTGLFLKKKFFFLVPAALFALPEAAPFSVDVQASPAIVTLGEHVSVKITVEHDARDVYSLNGFDPAPLAVPQDAPAPRVRREEVAPGRARTVFELVLADYGTLAPKLPDMTLSVTGPDGPRAVNLRGKPLKFRSLVAEEGQGSPERAHHGPKPPVPVMVHSYLWAWLLAGLAGALAALLYWRRRKKPLPAAPALLHYDELALQRLAALRSQPPGRALIFALSETVRAYLGERLQFNALDLTSEEFIAELRRRRLMGLDLAELIEEVRWEDLVKFAKLEPSLQECARAIDRAESIVHHTRPLRAVEKAA